MGARSLLRSRVERREQRDSLNRFWIGIGAIFGCRILPAPGAVSEWDGYRYYTYANVSPILNRSTSEFRVAEFAQLPRYGRRGRPIGI